MLNLTAPINTLGYGYTGYYFLKELYSMVKDIQYFNIGNPENMEELGNECILNSWVLNNAFRNINKNLPSVKIWHQNDLFMHPPCSKRYGFPIFELDTFTDIERHSLKSCDELIVCSQWAKSILVKNGIDIPISIVPLGVNIDIFNNFKHKTLNNSTVFLNCGKWELRKGHDVLLECFNKAFEENDTVQLWMMCDNPFLPDNGAEWVKKYKNSKLGDKIKIIPRQPTQQSVYNIMSMVDCGVFPSRAEGWNLEALEVLACGKQLITTKYSGNTEFCNSSNSKMITINSLEPANDGIWFNGQGNWAHYSNNAKEQLIYYMRDIHKSKQEKKLSENIAGISTAGNYTWNKAARKLLEVIKE